MKTSLLTPLMIIFFFSVIASAENPPIQEWVSYYAGTGSFDDLAQKIATDSSGNVYVTGQSIGISSYDFMTVKYNSSGALQWSARFDGPNHALDSPVAIAADNSGNVLVTGKSYYSSTGHFATIKYSPDGNQLWIAYYSGTESTDTPTAIAVDSSGNVYVTGTSKQTITGNDITTIKYSPEGNQLWVSLYHYGSYDFPSAMVLDSSNNVYVTGGVGASGSRDFGTIKYNTNGVQQWASRYNGTGSGDDWANAIAVDSSGNVYVGGQSTGVSPNGYDYATVKYNSSGTQQWVSRYSGSGSKSDIINSIALDSFSNVYVTGESNEAGTGRDFTTIKYNSSGTQQWVAHYDGPLSSADFARSIAVDASGNSYVTGPSVGAGSYDYATVKYNSSGTQQWAIRHDGSAGGLDYASALSLRGSYVYVTGYCSETGTYKDYVTIKYDLDGNQQWLVNFDGQAHLDDTPYDVKADSYGNVYVTGTAQGDSNSNDCVTVKFDSNGNQLWMARFDEAHFPDRGRVVAVDSIGNVYVGASGSTGTGSAYDYVTIKYDPNGGMLWTNIYNGPANDSDELMDMAVDNSGNVYVTGYSAAVSSHDDCFTIKYDTNGNTIWQARYESPSNAYSQGSDIALDNAGNVYVLGSTVNADFITIKYDSNGSQLWAKTYKGPLSSYGNAADIAVDAAGNVYITGAGDDDVNSLDWVTVKYNSSGTQLWAKRYNGPGKSYDEPLDMDIDSSGNVYVTGYCNAGSTGSDYATIKYGPDGNQLWVVLYNDYSNTDDTAVDVAVDVYGNVYVTGTSYLTGYDQNYVTIKYDANGNQLWTVTYDGGFGTDYAYDMTIDDFGNIYVVGNSTSAIGDRDYAVIKYSQPDFSVADADLNGDGIIDFTDFSILANQWLLGKLSWDVSYGSGDGIVNFIDYAALANNWQDDINQLSEFASQWLRPGAYNADIVPPPNGDNIVDMLDFAAMANSWLQSSIVVD
jgi:uncharacterized delta-60 repeat protein